MTDRSELVDALNEMVAQLSGVAGDFEGCLIANSATWRSLGPMSLGFAHYMHTDEQAPDDNVMCFERSQCPICKERSALEELNLMIEKISSVIERYGDHDVGCPGRVGDDCTCGYLEACKERSALEELNLMIEKISSVIERYGDHDVGCPGHVGDDCTCGYLEAVAEANRVKP